MLYYGEPVSQACQAEYTSLVDLSHLTVVRGGITGIVA